MSAADRFAWTWERMTDGLEAGPRPDVDELWHGTERQKIVRLVSPRRRWLLVLVPGIVLFLLAVRLGYLQFRQSSVYSSFVAHNQYRLIAVPAPRGEITDRNGIALATNIPNFTLAVIPAAIPTGTTDRTLFLRHLETLTGMPISEIEAKLQPSATYSRSDAIPLWSNIPYERALSLSVEVTELPGVTVEAYPTRSYTHGTSAAPVIGYIGAVSETELRQDASLLRTDEVGKTGLEWKYNRLLMGTPGYVAYERTGQNTFSEPVKKREPIPGQTLRLTVDAELQQRMYDRLQSAVTATHSTGGSAVAVDPRTGQVLALVSAPTYDSNWFVDPAQRVKAQDAVTNPKRLLLNRAISGQYPSGSIIKPLLGAAALAEKIITPGTTVSSVGGIKVGPNFFPDWKAGGHGVTNLAKAIADSVNTFFYQIGGGYERQLGLGVDRIVKYLSLFGWGRRLGIDLPNETDGFLPVKEWREASRVSPWRLGDTYHLAIGQGDLDVTPLQVVMSMAAVANGGTLYQPQLVAEIQGSTGAVVEHPGASVLQTNIVSPAILQTIRAAMRQGVTDGSSRALQDLPVAAAGKTGTAQFGNKGKTHSWFTAFAPYDHPTIVILVMVEGGGEGNATALPVAHDILRWYFNRQVSGVDNVSVKQ